MQRWEIKHRYTGAVLYAAGGETLVDLSADLAHRPDLQSRIRAALLRSL